VPSYLLPEALADENPQKIARVVNGDLAWNA
jgi:NADP-dependent aldehyde dehydrogenase